MPFNFRETINRGRRELHDKKSELADYTPPTGFPINDIHVRVHKDVVLDGEGDPLPNAKLADYSVFVILDLLEVPAPVRGAEITVRATGEVLTVDSADPPDGEFIRVWVT